jgi:tetratricopeptide (TPR) repeat protein
LGLALLEQGKLDEAITSLHRSLTLGPNSPETFNNLAVAYMRNGQPALAAENYRRALRLKPDYAEAHFNLGPALLSLGEFEQGWLEWEWRSKCHPTRSFARPRWAGECLAGKSIVVYDEDDSSSMTKMIGATGFNSADFSTCSGGKARA